MAAIDDFLDLLAEATRQIGHDYIQLPVAGQEDENYRERVYCYELYHQLRTLWPKSLNKFSLAGEIDKAGHPPIRNGNLDRVKPDLLVHVPGNMECNLVVIEVKPANKAGEGFEKDLKTLTAFRRAANYENAIHLTYGSSGNGTKQIIEKAKDFQKKNPKVIDLNLFDFWYHSKVGNQASILQVKEV